MKVNKHSLNAKKTDLIIFHQKAANIDYGIKFKLHGKSSKHSKISGDPSGQISIVEQTIVSFSSKAKLWDRDFKQIRT